MSDKDRWGDLMRAEDERHPRRSGDQRATLRRFTVRAVVAAAGLNAFLFAQAGIEQVGLGDFQNEVISAISGLFPSGGLRPAAHAPVASPSARAVATTGGS